MTITSEMMTYIRPINVSKDAEKTKIRVGLDYRSANAPTKAGVEKISGLSRSSIYLTLKTGRLSAKNALAMAQIFGVSPLYYTGETDTKEALSEANLRYFLISSDCLKYVDEETLSHIFNAPKNKRDERYTGLTLTESDEIFLSEFADTDAFKDVASMLNEEDAVTIERSAVSRGNVRQGRGSRHFCKAVRDIWVTIAALSALPLREKTNPSRLRLVRRPPAHACAFCIIACSGIMCHQLGNSARAGASARRPAGLSYNVTVHRVGWGRLHCFV